MLARIFPERFDNDYHGYQAASGPDGIPLATFPDAASQTILSLFAMIGLSRLLLGLLCVLALIRYRSMIPLLFVALLIEQVGRRLTLNYLPIPRVGEPPVGTIHLVILALIIVGLVLSLIDRTRSEPRTVASGALG